jgi:hypothetical protein
MKKPAHPFDFECECVVCDRSANRAFRRFEKFGMSRALAKELNEVLGLLDKKKRRRGITETA